jgi:hypothetical protein
MSVLEMPLKVKVVEKVRVKETPDTKTEILYSYKVQQSDQKFVPLYQKPPPPPPPSPTASEIFEAVNDNSLILNELLDCDEMTP